MTSDIFQHDWLVDGARSTTSGETTSVNEDPEGKTVSSRTISPIDGRTIVAVVGHCSPEGGITLAGVGFSSAPMLVQPGASPMPLSDEHGSARYRLALMRVHASRVAELLIGVALPTVAATGTGAFGSIRAEVSIDVDTGQLRIDVDPHDADTINLTRAIAAAIADALAIDEAEFPIASEINPEYGLPPERVWDLLQRTNTRQQSQPLRAHSISIGETSKDLP